MCLSAVVIALLGWDEIKKGWWKLSKCYRRGLTWRAWGLT